MQLINDTIAGLTLAAPHVFSNLAVYPLIAPSPRERSHRIWSVTISNS